MMFEENVMVALTSLQSSLCTSDTNVRETESLIVALIEEIEEAINDVLTGKDSETRAKSSERVYPSMTYLEEQPKDLSM